MADDHTDGTLSRRRLLASLATIGGSLSAAGVGTWSLFSDRERGDLTVRAGTVSLAAGDGSDPTITVDSVEAGASGTEHLELTNTGSIDAGLSVCVDGVAVAETDAARSKSPISGVAFDGCGKARVLFDRQPDSPVSVTFEHGDGERETVEIEPDDLGEDGSYERERNGGKNGYIERVVAGGRRWVNDGCEHVDEPSGESAVRSEAGDTDLAEALSLSLGIDPENGSEETLIDDAEVTSLTDGTTYREASTTLAGGETADLVVDWTADGSADRLDGELTIDLTVTLQS